MEVCPAFIDETGVLTESSVKQPVYGIGLLVVPETKEITDSFYRLHFNFIQKMANQRSKLRKKLQSGCTPLALAEIDILMWSTRHHEYKFSEVTHFNIQDYIDILNLYFSFPGLEFHALMLNRRDSNAGLSKWDNDSWVAYTHFAKKLLEERLTRDVFTIVDLQGEPDKTNVHLEDVLCSVNMVKGCLRATSDMSIYLQLVDLLLGCVQYDLKEQMGYYDSLSKRAKAKGQLAQLVKSKLGMGKGDAFLPSGELFTSRETPSIFSVSRGEW